MSRQMIAAGGSRKRHITKYPTIKESYENMVEECSSPMLINHLYLPIFEGLRSIVTKVRHGFTNVSEPARNRIGFSDLLRKSYIDKDGMYLGSEYKIEFSAEDFIRNPESDGDGPCNAECCLWKALEGCLGNLPFFAVIKENKFECDFCHRTLHYTCAHYLCSTKISEIWLLNNHDQSMAAKSVANNVLCSYLDHCMFCGRYKGQDRKLERSALFVLYCLGVVFEWRDILQYDLRDEFTIRDTSEVVDRAPSIGDKKGRMYREMKIKAMIVRCVDDRLIKDALCQSGIAHFRQRFQDCKEMSYSTFVKELVQFIAEKPDKCFYWRFLPWFSNEKEY